MNLLLAAAIVFALTAAGGALLLSYVLRGKPTPKMVTFIHGPAGALGIVLLLALWLRGETRVAASLGLFVLAALGGFFLLYRDLAHGHVPRPIAIVHGLVAVTAFVLLLRAF